MTRGAAVVPERRSSIGDTVRVEGRQINAAGTLSELRSDGNIDALEINVANNTHANVTLGGCFVVDGCSKATQLMIDGVPMTSDSLQPGDLVTSYNYLLPDYSKSTPFKNVVIPGVLDFQRKYIVVEHTHVRQLIQRGRTWGATILSHMPPLWITLFADRQEICKKDKSNRSAVSHSRGKTHA